MSLSVHIIDDDTRYQYALSQMIMHHYPHAVINVFLNGEKGLDDFKANATSPDKLPDITFLDIDMPVMDGWAFLDAYSPLTKELSKTGDLYLVSSSLLPTDKERGLSYPVVKDYIPKPISLEVLKRILSNGNGQDR